MASSGGDFSLKKQGTLKGEINSMNLRKASEPNV